MADRATKHLRDADPVLAALIDRLGSAPARTRAPRPSAGEHYAGLVRTIVGQQLSTRAAASIWQRLLTRKRHVDVTGNGVNHPNDYGHRVYAQAILALLLDPSLVRRPAAR